MEPKQADLTDIRLINLRDENGMGAFPNETPLLQTAVRGVLRLVNVAPVVPMPPVIGPTVLHLDTSKWNWPMNYHTARERGIRAVWIKVNQGLWPDSQFENNLKAAEDANMEIGFYHFADPAQTSVTPEQAAQQAADMISGAGRLSVWLDVERSGNLTPAGLLSYCKRWCDHFGGLTNRMLQVYTRLSFFNPYVARSQYWMQNDIGLMAARYHLGLQSPWSDGQYVPLDWPFGLQEFEEWQYSADGNGLGSYFGSTGALSIDLGLFKGDWTAFEKHYGLTEAPPPTDDCCEELQAQITVLSTRVDELSGQLVHVEAQTSSNTTQLDVQATQLQNVSGVVSNLEADFAKHLGNPDAHHSHDGETPPPIEPPPADETFTVLVANDSEANCSVYKIDNYGTECPGENPPGKPIPENKVHVFKLGERFEVYASAAVSCIDSASTPVVKTGYGDYYMVAGGQFDGHLVPKKRVLRV